ncbi:ester cyclase [Streptomyces sp. NPDC094032]|uniref:ester cyclase n=1 Tax=Streptomyces sp. NPDC094032 TaxID=3155308 RepID=UPI0033179E4A
MDSVQRNMQVFASGDRSWNARTDDFIMAHTPDCVVHQPGSHEPRVGRADHMADMEVFFKAFPDIEIGPVGDDGRPRYQTQFGSGEWMAGISVMSGTHEGELNLFGRVVPPTGKKVEITLATIARFEDGKIAEEYLFYDMLLLAKDLGVWP